MVLRILNMMKQQNYAKFASIGAITLLSFNLVAPQNAQAIITNGSFELGSYDGGSFEMLSNGDTDLIGWTIGGSGVDWHNSNEFTSPQDSNFLVDLNLIGIGQFNTGTLSQTFSTSIGENYQLSFYLAGAGSNLGFSNPRQVTVNIAGINQNFSTPASLNTNLIWKQQTLVFTATAPSTTLTFSSPDGTGFWGPLVDNVSVASVPFEFSPTLGLITVGSLFGISRLRKSTKSFKLK
jgi:choice-of-anchor C domain-containing protein